MKTVLVVDDEMEIRELLQARLLGSGFNVVEASDGVEALEVINDVEVDLILLDVSMPSMDGYVFAKEIRWSPDHKNIPIIVLSGMIQSKELFKTLGIHNFINKPFDSEALLPTINSVLMENNQNQDSSKRILIIDDEAEIVDLMGDRLAAEHYEVLKAYDGQEGLLIIKKEHPDLIIMDIMMPEINGFNLCRIIKSNEHFSHIPVIIITAGSSKEDRKIAKEVKANQFLRKPFESKQLLQKMHELGC